jgi:parvulin-like peptidyl-prolyl isomerase
MRKLHLIVLVLALLGLAAACGGGEKGVPDGAVAVVGDEEITKAEFDALIGRAEKAFEQQKRDFPKAGTPEYKTLQNQAVQYLVQQAKYRQAADELDVEIEDKDIDARLEQVTKQYFGGNKAEYEKNLEKQGLTEEQVRKEIENQLISEKIYEKVTEGVKVTDEDIQKYYNDHKKDYKVPETREVRHILVAKKPKADQLRAQLADGANFATLAKNNSLDTGSKANGGKLTARRGETVPPFDKAAFSLDKGEISQPIKTQFGYHIIEALGDVRPASTTPLKDVKEQIRQQLLQERRQKAIADWSTDLNEDFEDEISYQVGYAPPETNQTTTASQ